MIESLPHRHRQAAAEHNGREEHAMTIGVAELYYDPWKAGTLPQQVIDAVGMTRIDSNPDKK